MQTTGPSTGLAYDAAGRLIIDVRGPRFGAAITSVVLAAALILQGGVGVALVAWQWTMFAIAAGAGLRFSVYGNLFRAIKRRFDLGPPPATEPEAGPRFAQACGLAVLTVALVAFALDGHVIVPDMLVEKLERPVQHQAVFGTVIDDLCECRHITNHGSSNHGSTCPFR